MITVLVNGVVDEIAFTVICRPVGFDAKVSTTVCGSSRRVVEAEAPPASVAVNVSSRYDGYS